MSQEEVTGNPLKGGIVLDLKYNILPKASKLITAENIGEVIDACGSVLQLSHIARKEGLLALEEYRYKELCDDNTRTKFLAKAIELIVDGVDPEYVRELLTNNIIVNGNYGFNEYLKFIIMEGALQVQAGFNPLLIMEYLISFVPESVETTVRAEMEKRYEYVRNNYYSGLEEDWLNAEPTPVDSLSIRLFNAYTEKLTPKELQTIVMEVDKARLCDVLLHSSMEVKNRFSDALTSGLRVSLGMYIEGTKYMDVEKDTICVLKEIDKLMCSGEISEYFYYKDNQTDEIIQLSEDLKKQYFPWLAGEADVEPVAYLTDTCSHETIITVSDNWDIANFIEAGEKDKGARQAYKDMAHALVYELNPGNAGTFPIEELVKYTYPHNAHLILYVTGIDESWCSEEGSKFASLADYLQSKGIDVYFERKEFEARY